MDREGCAKAHLTMNTDEAVILFDNAVDGGKVKSCSFSEAFCCKERLKDMVYDFLTHAVTVVANT